MLWASYGASPPYKDSKIAGAVVLLCGALWRPSSGWGRAHSLLGCKAPLRGSLPQGYPSAALRDIPRGADGRPSAG